MCITYNKSALSKVDPVNLTVFNFCYVCTILISNHIQLIVNCPPNLQSSVVSTVVSYIMKWECRLNIHISAQLRNMWTVLIIFPRKSCDAGPMPLLRETFIGCSVMECACFATANSLKYLCVVCGNKLAYFYDLLN